jgi:hypothetical protein
MRHRGAEPVGAAVGGFNGHSFGRGGVRAAISEGEE